MFCSRPGGSAKRSEEMNPDRKVPTSDNAFSGPSRNVYRLVHNGAHLTNMYRTGYTISDRVYQALNSGCPPRQRFIQVKLMSCGVTVLPGKARIYRKVLNELWNQFGTVLRFYYNPKFRFCVVEYNTYDEAQLAVRTINNRPSMVDAINYVASCYTVEDKELVLMVLRVFFPDSAFNNPIAVWNVNTQLFDLDVYS